MPLLRPAFLRPAFRRRSRLVPVPLAACLAACLAASQPARAAGSLLLLDTPPETTSWSAGASVRGWPRAPGSRHSHDSLLPALDYEATNGLFAATDTGLGWNLAPVLLDGPAAKDWQVGLRVWPQPGRPRRETPPGVQGLGTRAVTEAFANVQALPALLLQSGISWGGGRHHDGGQFELGATSGVPLGDDLLAVSLAATYANAAQLRGSFGVSAGEAQAAGLAAWQPAGGWQDWSVAFSGEHKFSADWSASGQWLRAQLVGQAARSPLTHSRSQPSFIVSLWHRF